MSEKKKKKDKRAYLNNFILNDNNEYVYQGDRFILDIDEEKKKIVFRKLLITYIVLILSVLSVGLLPFKGMTNTFYVIIPFVCEFVLSIMLVPVMYNILKKKEFRDYEYNKNIERIKPYTGIIMVNSIFGIIGTLVFIYQNGYDPICITILFLFSKIITFFATRYLLKVCDYLVYKKV